MEILTGSKFDQCVLNMSLINLCNQKSHVGKEMLNIYQAWKEETSEAIENPWRDLHQFNIFVPHPKQEYENITLAGGLTKGYNVEVEPVKDKSQIPDTYDIPSGGHFVVVLKQKGLDLDFKIAATGIFIRPLAVLSLDIIIDAELGEYNPLLLQHPIIRDYPEGWERKLQMFLNREISSEDLPNLVRYVDQTFNQDYHPPSWDDLYYQ